MNSEAPKLEVGRAALKGGDTGFFLKSENQGIATLPNVPKKSGKNSITNLVGVDVWARERGIPERLNISDE